MAFADKVLTCNVVQSQLAQACAALAINGTNFSFNVGLQSAFDVADLAWQCAFYHDDVHGLVHLMGKRANAPSAWKHQYFDLSTNQWVVVSNGMWNNDGHIYGNLTMDFTTGDLYVSRSFAGSDFPRRLRRWIYANRAQGVGAWGTAPTSQDGFTVNEESHANGICFHPNLYGPNDPGTIWVNQQNIHYWRKNTDGRATTSVNYGTYGDKEGANVYWPFNDIAIAGGSNRRLVGFKPNTTPGGAPRIIDLGLAPIRAQGGSHEDGPGFGSLHVHPATPSKLVLMETAGSAYYTGTMSGDTLTWSGASTHPFPRTPRVVCSLRGGLGCFWAIGQGDSQYNGGFSSQFSHLWRPPL